MRHRILAFNIYHLESHNLTNHRHSYLGIKIQNKYLLKVYSLLKKLRILTLLLTLFPLFVCLHYFFKDGTWSLTVLQPKLKKKIMKGRTRTHVACKDVGGMLRAEVLSRTGDKEMEEGDIGVD